MSNDTQSMRGLAESLLRYGKSKGATEMEVAIDEGTEFSVRVLNQEVEKLTQAGSKGIALRVIVEGKTATASSSDFTKTTLEKLVDLVMQNFQHGQATILEVKAAQASYESAAYQLINFQYAGKSAEIELKQMILKKSEISYCWKKMIVRKI